MIPYASAIFIELYEMNKNEFAVAIALKNQTDSQRIYNINIPGKSQVNIMIGYTDLQVLWLY